MNVRSFMDIYKSIKGRKKTYIVTRIDADYQTVIRYAKRFFRCSEAHITVEPAWIYKGYLYLEDPEKKGAKKVSVAYWV